MQKITKQPQPTYLSNQSLGIHNLPSHCTSSHEKSNSSTKKHNTQTTRKSKGKIKEKSSLEILNVLKSYMSNSEFEKPKQQQLQSSQKGNPWNLMKTEVMTHKKCQTSEIDYLQTPNYKFDSLQLQEIVLQRIDPDVRSKSFCIFIDHEIQKMNEHVSKMELVYERNMGIAQIMNPLNSLILMMNFIIGKMAYKGEQILLECDRVDCFNCELKAELIMIKNENEILLKRVSLINETELELREEAGRLRGVMESYQLENHQLRTEIHILNQVIQEMNIQVEKCETKLLTKSRELNCLVEEHNKMAEYNGEFEEEMKEHLNTLNRVRYLEEQLEMMEAEKEKWRYRCHEEMNENELDE